MIISFFLFFYISNRVTKFRVFTGTFVAVLYSVVQGKSGLIPENLNVGTYLVVLMLMMSIGSLIYDIVKHKGFNINKEDKDPWIIRSIAIFIAIPIILCLLILLIYPNLFFAGKHSFMSYALNALISSVTSFGGGEAYISVADGFFVQSGFIPQEIYYNQIVAISNALPGPILVKVAAAVGYYVGFVKGGIIAGLLLAMIGTSLSVGASSVFGLVILATFNSVKDSVRLSLIKKYILPIICGLLISTTLTMLNEMLKITVNIKHVNPFISMFGIVAIYVSMWIAHKKYHIGDLYILLGGGLLTLVLLSMI